MKTLLIATAVALSLAPACFAQQETGHTVTRVTQAEMDEARQKFLDSQMIVLEEDSARITADMDKAKYRGEENFLLHIHLKNEGTKYFGSPKIILDAQEVYEFYNISVVDQTGRQVPQLKIEKWPVTSWSPGWGLKPGDTQEATVWLNNLFDFTYGSKFKVTVSKTFRKDGKLVTVSSEPVEFEIVTRNLIARWGYWETPKERKE